MPERTLVINGRVVTPAGIDRHDILIEDGFIREAGDSVRDQAPDAAIVDAGGLHILPGLVDTHTHMREPGMTHKEDFTSGTRAALAGGITTILAMPNTIPPLTTQETLDQALALAAAKAVCDYGLYLGATDDNASHAAAVQGAVALKLFMGSSTGTLLVKDVATQLAHFEATPPDRIIAVHAEDEDAVQYYARAGVRRPPICAALATARAITLAELTGRRLHILHVSTAYELQLIQEAKQRGARVTCETGPQYLFLSTDDSATLGGFGLCQPPVREPGETGRLWAALDVVDLLATDHAPHTMEEKSGPTPPGGLTGLETALPLMLTAVHDGRLGLPDLARLMSAAPAEIFGLAHKGRIAPGYHADLTFIDPDEVWTIRNDRLFTRAGWSPFDGREVRGRVRAVYRRGRLAFDGGQVLAAPGSGEQVMQS